MKLVRYWCNFNQEGTRKVPYGIDGHRLSNAQGTPEDLARLGSFEDACERVRKGRADALGFSFREGCMHSCIDFDGLGSVIRHAGILDQTWSETSFSGEGAHAYFTGNFRTNKKDNEHGIEFFSTKGNVLITGWPHAGTDCGVIDSKRIAGPLLQQYINGEPYAPTRARVKSLPDVDTPENIDKLKRALAAIDCRGIGSDDWLHITQAAHSMNPAHDGEPFRLWDRWCRTDKDGVTKDGSPRYNKENNIKRWDSSGQQRGITLATAIKMAKDTGNWEEPKRPKRSNGPEQNFHLSDLIQFKLPEPEVFIKDLIAEGLTLLVGQPKVAKKTFWMIQCAALASAGEPFIGFQPVKPLRVLCYFLEEGDEDMLGIPPANVILKRIKEMGLQSLAKNVDFRFKLAPLHDGGLEELRKAATEYDLIFIDSWAMIYNEEADKMRNVWRRDYEQLRPVRNIARENHCAIVVAMHAGKESDVREALEASATTLGVQASADGMIVLQRPDKDDSRKYRMSLHHRGLTPKDFQLGWEDNTLLWMMVGPWLGVGRKSDALDVLLERVPEEWSDPLSTLQIARYVYGGPQAEKNRSNLSKILASLKRDKLVDESSEGKTKLWRPTSAAYLRNTD